VPPNEMTQPTDEADVTTFQSRATTIVAQESTVQAGVQQVSLIRRSTAQDAELQPKDADVISQCFKEAIIVSQARRFTLTKQCQQKRERRPRLY